MKAEKRAELGNRLQALVRKSTGQNEATNADGGYTVNHAILPDILKPDFAEGTIYERCRIINVSANNANGLKIPVANVTAVNENTVKGGFRAYSVSEGVTKTPSKGSFSQLDLALNKVAVVVYATDELIADNEALATYISDGAQEAFGALVDYHIMYGNGGVMNGIVNLACTGNVAISSPITAGELHDIADAYYGGKNGVWLVSKDMLSDILDLYETAAAGSIMLTAEGNQYYLFGYPIIVSDVMDSVNICLADLSQYVVIQKDIKTAVNTSLKFVEDEIAYRYVLRINGSGIWPQPITLGDNSVVYPFVISTAMENSSSSFSSSSSNEYSSSSSKSSVGNSESSEMNSGSSQSLSTESSDSGSESSGSSDSSSSDSTNSSDSSGG